jgi:hypothetical protein
MRPAAALAIALVLAAGACSKSESTEGKDSARSAGAAPVPLPPVAAATPGRPGMVRPVVTAGGATLTAAARPYWFEVDLACYVAAITMNGDAHPIDPIEKVKPGLAAALAAAHFDFEKDLLTVALSECGSGLCMYFGTVMKDVAQMRALVSGILGKPPEEPEPNHFVTRFEGPAGERAVHLRFLPIDWDGLTVPDDPRARNLRRATHVLFVFADASSAPVPDALAQLAQPAAAQKRLAEIESLATDRRGRCAIGELPAMTAIRPGFDLTGGAFIAVTPPRVAEDQLAALIGASRSFDLEIKLDLSKTPTTADVEGWLEQGRQAFTAMASGTPAPPGLVELIRVILEKALAYRIGDGHLVLSWHTSRVPKESLEAAEAQLKQMMGTP